MARTRTVAIAAGVLLAGAFLAGYLPERRQRASAEAELERLGNRVTVAEDRVRASELLGRILMVKEVTAHQDFGQAQDLSSGFFDAVRAEASTTHDAQLRDGLNAALAGRDRVIAALAKADPGAVELLHGIELRLRQALGYPIQTAAAPQ